MDKWTQQLHDKLAEREVAPPDDLWADIEAALPNNLAGSEKSHARFVPLRRWAVVASVALLTAGGGYLLWQSPTPEEPAPQPQPELSQAEPSEPQASEDPQTTRPSSSIIAQTPSTKLIPSVKDSVMEPIAPIPTQQDLADNTQETPAQSSEEIINHDVDETIRQIDEEIALLSSKSDKHISLNLYASNGFVHLQKVNGVRMDDELAARYNVEQYLPHNRAFSRSDGPIYLVGYEERQKHYLPIAVGLSIGYPLSSKWSLSSGITYTRLRSDFTSIIEGSSISQEQTLHYLGIPLNAQYRLFHRGGLNIYLSGGAEADYNIKTHLASEGVTQHLDRDRWQFSIQGGVGLQYDILPQIGLYAEPGVKHYFDNGSRMRNYFKDQPTSFNLQLGLRLNILQK